MQDYLTPNEAAEKATVSRTTIITWCHDYGIGWKTGGRWRVDPTELEKLLDGRLYREMKKPRK